LPCARAQLCRVYSFLVGQDLAIVRNSAYSNEDIKTFWSDIFDKFAGQTDEQFVNYISALFADVNSAEKGVTLDAANRLYVEKSFTLEEAFLKIIASHFAGQLQQVHFMDKEVVVHEINSWVAKQTRDKIKNLVCVENIHDDTRLMLINAVYFKGTWKEQFRKELTRKKPFYISENNQNEVDMMAMKEKFSYYEDDDVKVLGMPYVGDQTQMFIILPQRRFGLADVEQNLTGKKLLSYVQRSCDTEVEVIRVLELFFPCLLKINLNIG
uniref:SERPIN domain-containing protein n=1 Tax=Gongylonema pulchrum TaxID=637853 RepID=A0A183D381_9BILA